MNKFIIILVALAIFTSPFTINAQTNLSEQERANIISLIQRINILIEQKIKEKLIQTNSSDTSKEASIKSTLNNSRALAELYYDSNSSSYKDLCIKNNLYGTKKIDSNVTCRSDKDWYLMYTKLKTNIFYCVDSTGAAVTVSNKPTTSCLVNNNVEISNPLRLPTAEKIKVPLSARKVWSADLYHKYLQQSFWEMRGDSYSWKYDMNGGSYSGVCANQYVIRPYLEMMKSDGLKNIFCQDSKTWFHVQATMPNGTKFCLNRNDAEDNDDEDSMRNCSAVSSNKFENTLKIN